MSDHQADRAHRELRGVIEEPQGNAVSSRKEPPIDILETMMRRFSQIISAIALGFMVIGFISLSPQHLPLSTPVLPLYDLVNFSHNPIGLIAMCVGIALLALLPALRVLLALVLFLPRGRWVNILAATIVLIELIFSLKMGG